MCLTVPDNSSDMLGRGGRGHDPDSSVRFIVLKVCEVCISRMCDLKRDVALQCSQESTEHRCCGEDMWLCDVRESAKNSGVVERECGFVVCVRVHRI